MREKVLEFLREKKGIPEERYNKAMELYRKSEGKSIPSVNYYSRAGFTAVNLQNICYDLQKLHGITDMELRMKVKPVDSDQLPVNSDQLPVDSDQLPVGSDQLPVDSNQLPEGTNDALKNMDVNAEEVKPDGSTNDTGSGSDDDITDADGKNLVDFTKAIEEAPDNVKGGLKLREHFPFLSEADCPDKLKILVADMITAWIQYKENHAELVKVTAEGSEKTLSDTILYELAKETIEAFELNHAIWDELEYYKEHGEILGNHPIFADDILKQKVANLTDAKLVTRRNTLRSYISRESKKLEKNPEEDAAVKIRKKIQEYTQELNLVEERLA